VTPAVLAQSGERFTGPIGLLVIVLIGVATILLIVSMNKRIKRLPPSFPEPPAADSEPERPDDGPQVPPPR
jgi:hypothetical protein